MRLLKGGHYQQWINRNVKRTITLIGSGHFKRDNEQQDIIYSKNETNNLLVCDDKAMHREVVD